MKFLFLLCLPLWKYFSAIFIEKEVYVNDNGKNTFSFIYIYSNEFLHGSRDKNFGIPIKYF